MYVVSKKEDFSYIKLEHIQDKYYNMKMRTYLGKRGVLSPYTQLYYCAHQLCMFSTTKSVQKNLSSDVKISLIFLNNNREN